MTKSPKPKANGNRGCLPPKKPAGCAPSASGPDDGHNDLNKLVDDYSARQKGKQPGTQAAVLNAYRKETCWKTALKMAAMGENDQGKRHRHQWRLNEADMDCAWKKLRRERKLQSAKSFEEIHEILKDVCGSISGLGELYAYDTSLRIGAHRRFMPKWVYLHAGSRKGAKALGLNTKDKRLAAKDFPPPLSRMKPHEIEDFLCIYKSRLGYSSHSLPLPSPPDHLPP